MYKFVLQGNCYSRRFLFTLLLHWSAELVQFHCSLSRIFLLFRYVTVLDVFVCCIWCNLLCGRPLCMDNFSVLQTFREFQSKCAGYCACLVVKIALHFLEFHKKIGLYQYILIKLWSTKYNENLFGESMVFTWVTLPPSVSRLSRQCGILNISQPYRPSQPVTRIALLYGDGVCFVWDTNWTVSTATSSQYLAVNYEPIV
jgi:hypothetical protein